jgi:hypothetical protein
MEINLIWDDLLTLAANGQVVKDGIPITIGWLMRAHVHHFVRDSPDGSKSFVRFTIDEADRHSIQNSWYPSSPKGQVDHRTFVRPSSPRSSLL